MSTQTKSLYPAERLGREEKITLFPNREVKDYFTEIVTLQKRHKTDGLKVQVPLDRQQAGASRTMVRGQL